MRKTINTFLLIFIQLPIFAQVISSNPAFPKASNSILVTFDANEGNKALQNFNQSIYAHAGVITDKSTSSTDWKYVQGTWGTTNAPLMTSIGGGKYTLSINNPQNFYSVPSDEKILKLSFVFRNQLGTIVAREADGGDIFLDIYEDILATSISSPSNNTIQQIGNIPVSGISSKIANLSLWVNGTQVASEMNETQISHNYSAANPGNYQVVLNATENGNTASDTTNFVINPTLQTQQVPLGMKLGINQTSPNSVTFVLSAPDKNFVYLIGSLNDWTLNTDYFMKRDPNGYVFWLELTNLSASEDLFFQYNIDGNIHIGDPCSKLVLDPANDRWIQISTFPNLPDYPNGKTSGIVTWHRMRADDYNWEVANFQAPAERDLIIYELLVRDFIANHDYQTVLDSLDYLTNLGINAIQLMPIQEFEGNESWGYNPSYHMALDKYYGSPENLKKLVDECHKRGIAIIVDVVYNHGFSQSPLCQMYWDPVTFKPTQQNPFVNPDPKHDFNVGYDFNHESPYFKEILKRWMQYWLEEYKIDGFRFDLSKGFTQNNTLGNIGAWNRYDASRITNLKRIYDEMKEVNTKAYCILEHFADNDEERELANRGMMLWGNMHGQFKEGILGFNSNLTGTDYKARNYNQPKLIGYGESHDEERLIVDAMKFGNNSVGYNVRQLNTALKRMELCAVFLYSIPGPKMIWQFGELGYDVSIDFNGRTGNKPIRWNYLSQPNRLSVYNTYSEMARLKTTLDAFQTDNYGLDLAGKGKRIHLSGNETKMVVLGNFDVVGFDMVGDFQNTGWWHEYFSGDSINVSATNRQIFLEAGEYQIWTNKRIKPYDKKIGINELEVKKLNFFPNPATEVIFFQKNQRIKEIQVYNLSGKIILTKKSAFFMEELEVSTLANGSYVIRAISDEAIYSNSLVVY